MPLPEIVMDFLNENARRESNGEPRVDDNLFKVGALDSFALVDFVTVLEEHCNITVPDSDINPVNFQSIQAIEQYVESRRS